MTLPGSEKWKYHKEKMFAFMYYVSNFCSSIASDSAFLASNPLMVKSKS